MLNVKKIAREPEPVVDALHAMGGSIRAARVRRRMSARDLADRVGVSLPTLRKLERGEGGVSMSVFSTALWVLGLLEAVQDSVSPDRDRVGVALDVSRLPKRVHSAHGHDLEGL